jgi:anti-sigma regulatory factor (Ser/Thr protein kinase)
MTVMEVRLSSAFRTSLPVVHPGAMAPVREATRACLRRWGREEVSEVVTLGVTELLTNVLKHAGGGCELTILITGEDIVVAVRDFDDTLPVIRELSLDSEGGRGLVLLSLLVEELSTERLPIGKRVCFRVKCTAGTGEIGC